MPSSLAGSQPLHDKVREAIAAQIRSGAIPSGTRLQSERDLADQMGVSRVTVRRALDALAEDGLVRAARGSGRFVNDTALVEPPNALLSFTELGAQRGLEATSRVLRSHVRPATLEEAEVLGTAPGADLFELERLRMLDTVAVALDHARVPLALAPELPTIDFSEASLYAVLDAAGAGLARADYTTEAVAADAVRARELGIEAGDPLLLARTTSYDETDRVVELGETAYRCDRYRFRATLVRKRQPGGGTTT
jgi:DNA-binding GntR family transcriptional regulator